MICFLFRTELQRFKLILIDGVYGWVDDSSSDDSQAMTDRAGSQGSLAASLMSAINLRSDNKLANISTLNKLLTN